MPSPQMRGVLWAAIGPLSSVAPLAELAPPALKSAAEWKFALVRLQGEFQCVLSSGSGHRQRAWISNKFGAWHVRVFHLSQEPCRRGRRNWYYPGVPPLSRREFDPTTLVHSSAPDRHHRY